MPDSTSNPMPPEEIPSCDCCIVGGGPAGMVLALLLARQGIEVVLLESRRDFDRDFRGDTLHASAIENLAEIGLAESVLALSRSRLEAVRLVTDEGSWRMADFSRLKSPFPFIALLPQVEFLDFLAKEAEQYASFRLFMGAKARQLIDADGEIRGVVFRRDGELFSLRSQLVVGADGRGSQMRRSSELDLNPTAPPMDVVWFRLPKTDDDSGLDEATLRVGSGSLLVLFERGAYWQVGYVIVKGSFKAIRQEGIESLRQKVAALAPHFARRLETLDDWKDLAVLAVETGCVERWYRPGILLIGDAAHVMSPVGGVGINYAIQDAVAAANLLTLPLLRGELESEHLAAVQQRRQMPTRIVQKAQSAIQRRIVAAALDGSRPFRLPWLARLVSHSGWLQGLLAYGIGFGPRHESVRFRQAGTVSQTNRSH